MNHMLQEFLNTRERDENGRCLDFSLPQAEISARFLIAQMQHGQDHLVYADLFNCKVLGLWGSQDGMDLISPMGECLIHGCFEPSHILQQQFKKWHYPNAIQSQDTGHHNCYPYWIILETLLKLRERGISSVSYSEFRIAIATIPDRVSIDTSVELLCEIYQAEDQQEYQEINDLEILGSNLKKTGTKLSVILTLLPHLSFENERLCLESHISNEQYWQMIHYFYQHYDLYRSSEEYGGRAYQQFLSTNIVNNRYGIFPAMSLSNQAREFMSQQFQSGLQYPYKNLLLNGVPGTGKSYFFEQLCKDTIFAVEDETQFRCQTLESIRQEQILRINVHDALNNAELMQGIAVMTKQNNIQYVEKHGLVLKQVMKAIALPSLPFVIILEEIQENSLNRIIGDLIFLMEESRRTDFSVVGDQPELLENGINIEGISARCRENGENNIVTLPSLVEKDAEFQLCMPSNLFLFCTSNYREDKKVLEDNLMRRFQVVEKYPNPSVVQNAVARQFLKDLNDGIMSVLQKSEMHPERFLIGHAIWMGVHDLSNFARVLSKVVIEFKDIKEIEWSTFKNILEKTQLNITENSYMEIISHLQDIYFDMTAQSSSIKESIESMFAQQ